MKRIILLTFLLMVSFSFSQKKKTKKPYKPKTTKIVKKEVTTVSEIPAPVETPPMVVAKSPSIDPDSETYNSVTKSAEFPGGTEAFRKYIATNMVFPSDLTGTLRTVIQFVVEKDGSTSNLKIQYTDFVSEITKQEIEKNVNFLLTKSKTWIPAEKNGVPVRSQYRLPMTFRLE